MNDFEINCVNKAAGDWAHELITHIGNRKGGWRITKEEAIFAIESRTSTFYTVDKTTGKRADVRVLREIGKAPLLRTWADGKWTDGLLAQSECGPGCRIV